MVPQVTTREYSSSFRSEVAELDTKRVIEISDLKDDIERRKKFLDGLVARRAKQLERLVDFKNDKDDYYFMAAIENILNYSELEKE